jgi:histidinol-phosphate aminotransferase
MDRKNFIRFDLNENSLDPPESVKSALKAFIDANRIQMYPEYGSFMETLSGYTGVPVSRLMITNGSDQAIELILRAFLQPGDTMMIARPEFPIFTQIAGVIGAAVRGIDYAPDMAFPFETFMQALEPSPELIVLINPNNPTGTPMTLAQIREILDARPETPVVVDEAYFEYTGVSAQGFLNSHPNLIITRTFSKAFAMAGLRLGYLMAREEIIAELHKIRCPFDINACALVAAKAQLADPRFWQAYVREVMTRSKPFLETFFIEHGVVFFTGAAHFFLVNPRNRDLAVRYLKESGILVRPMVADPICGTFRMNVGTLDQTRRFTEVYHAYLREHEQP